MEKLNTLLGRRNFLRKTALVSAGLTGLTVLPQRVWAEELNPEDEKPNIIGPLKGFSPQIGTMVSMMNW
jgi:hypothetical protein